MFERFTDRARRALVVAQDEARQMRHEFIRPEHLLLGLAQGDGVAALALRQDGVDAAELRKRVDAAFAKAPDSFPRNKVPFSPRAKKSLELALREALRLGHNYIGTEHLLLGVLRGADGKDPSLKQVLQADSDDLRARVMELIPNAAGRGPQRSPALVAAMSRAGKLAGPDPMTTGHLVAAVLGDDLSQASKSLRALGVTAEAFTAALGGVDVGETSDALPTASSFELRIDDAATKIEDPSLASALKRLGPEQIAALLRRALGIGHEDEAAG